MLYDHEENLFILWLFFMGLQRTLVLPTPLSISPMQRYHALVLIPRMSSFWHVMLLVYSHQWASWTWHKQCTISSVATLLWYVPCHYFDHVIILIQIWGYLVITWILCIILYWVWRTEENAHVDVVANNYFSILVIEFEFVLDFR